MLRFTRSTVGWLLVLMAVTLTADDVAWAGTPGEAGMLSLRMGVGARESGMGDAGVASSTGAAAIFWNPANNVFEDFETTLVLQHHRYLDLFNQEAAAVAHRVGNGVLGLIFMGFYSDEILRASGEPVGAYEGTFKPYDVAVGLSYSHRVGERFALGLNGKLVYERIDIYSDTGMALDLFATHEAIIPGLRFAGSWTNIGGQMNLYNDPFDLPTAWKVGAAYTPDRGILANNVTLAGDLFFPEDTNAKAHVGLEYRPLDLLALRVGTKINYELYGMTAGFGIRAWEGGTLDYAYQDMTIDGFEKGHKFSLNLVW